MKTFQFTVYIGPNETIIISLDEFKETLILTKSKSHIQGNSEIVVEAMVQTTSDKFNFALGKINAKNKEEANNMLIKKFK